MFIFDYWLQNMYTLWFTFLDFLVGGMECMGARLQPTHRAVCRKQGAVSALSLPRGSHKGSFLPVSSGSQGATIGGS